MYTWCKGVFIIAHFNLAKLEYSLCALILICQRVSLLKWNEQLISNQRLWTVIKYFCVSPGLGLDSRQPCDQQKMIPFIPFKPFIWPSVYLLLYWHRPTSPYLNIDLCRLLFWCITRTYLLSTSFSRCGRQGFGKTAFYISWKWMHLFAIQSTTSSISSALT